MEIGDNIRTAIGYICITIVLVSCIICYILFWISLSLPSDYSFNIDITADDNLLNISETMDEMQERQYKYNTIQTEHYVDVICSGETYTRRLDDSYFDPWSSPCGIITLRKMSYENDIYDEKDNKEVKEK